MVFNGLRNSGFAFRLAKLCLGQCALVFLCVILFASIANAQEPVKLAEPTFKAGEESFTCS
jgi:hypothetical protein